MQKRLFIILASLVCVASSAMAANRFVLQESKRDRLASLKDINPRNPGKIEPVTPNMNPAFQGMPAQTLPGSLPMPPTIQNFEGMSASGHIPPDTCGEAGRHHYVQMVNRQTAVFDKTGNILFGPVDTNTLWTGFGGICETQNQGDPVVVYDQLANRWLISQFAYVSTKVHLECIAVSETNDPTGAYYRYSYSFPAFNDYPKIGVWPDGYYATYTLRDAGFNPIGGRICAYERSKMLKGDPARTQCFDLGLENRRLLPADLDGKTRPPKGSPHFSMNVQARSLNLWKLKVNWKSPSRTKVTGPIDIPVADYKPACNSDDQKVCIPQPGINRRLHAFSDRLMFRLSYRNFGSHESLVTNHSVQIKNGISAVRWYEVRSPNSAPFLFQQGTHSPDKTHRWMGSAASDLNGNIAIGYSVSSPSVYPGIRYAGRLVTDPKGTMPQGEGIIMNGSGSQTYHRWGDYSDLTVDPVDDCTFWYTSEYIQTTGTLNWKTRIASFKFPLCGCTEPAGITNNTATDVKYGSGVTISWAGDPGNWGDNETGTRSYDVLRDGIVLVSKLPYGTTSYTDDSGVKNRNYTYTVRYKNGCTQNTVTAGAQAGDFNRWNFRNR